MSGWGVIPSIRVADLAEALDFYEGRLGFSAEGDAQQPNVSIVRGDARLMLETTADFYGDDYNAAIRRRLGSVSPTALYMEADDLEALYRTLQDAGSTIVDPLADRPWGQAEFTVEDPSGNWLTFWKKR
ncbi:MAG TPA: VOC family protein [Gaiellaceae bacterium]|nr:VOC family protein [Gaiellaceae bacterium]